MRILLFIVTTLLQLLSIAHGQYDDYDGYDGYGGGGGGGGYGGQIETPQMTSVVVKLNTAEEITQFLSASPTHPVIIGYFQSEDSPDLEILSGVALDVGMGYKFASVTSKDILKEKKYTGTTLFVYKISKDLDTKTDKPRSRFPSKTLSKSTLTKFIYEKSLPTIGEITSDTEKYYDHVESISLITALGDYNHDKNEKAYQYILTRLRKVALKYPNKYHFIIGNKNDYQQMILDYDFPITSVNKKGEVLLGLKLQNMLYTMTSSFSVEHIESFLDDVKKGTVIGKDKKAVAPPKRSNDEDGSDDSGPSHVVTLTESNFSQVVLEDRTKDVMVEFYAPWCGHCKALKPEYKTLADEFVNDDTVVIAAMDADTHKPPASFNVQGYPTIFYVPADSKKPQVYEGGRSAEAMKEFILSHKTTSPF